MKVEEIVSDELDFIQKNPTLYKINEQLTYQNGFEHGYLQGKTDIVKRINELKEHYADACCICTKMDCDVCDIKTFIKELEQIGAEE